MKNPLLWILGAGAALVIFDRVVMASRSSPPGPGPGPLGPSVLPSGAIVPAPSEAVQTLPTPASGSITFALPPGAIAWGLTSYRRADWSEGPLAWNPSRDPITTSAAKGDTFTLSWITPTVDAYSAVYTLV